MSLPQALAYHLWVSDTTRYLMVLIGMVALRYKQRHNADCHPRVSVRKHDAGLLGSVMR
jgi:hypothetical protein